MRNEAGFSVRGRSAEHGFTLLEILVALAVFSLAALALIRLETASVRGAGVLDRTLVANMVARNVALEAVTEARPPATGASAGVAVNGGRAWRWSRQVTPTGDTRIVRIEVAVQGRTGQVLGRATMVRPATPEVGAVTAHCTSPAQTGAQFCAAERQGAVLSRERHRCWAPACAGVEEKGMARSGGFTLVEVLVALLIFAILASAGVALLSFSVRAQAATGAKLDDLAALNRTLAILSADLAQATARPTRDEAGTVLPAFVGEASGDVQPMLRLVRGGWTNLDQQPRPGVQKVAYRLDGGVLQRLAWPQLDGAAPLPVAPLLDRVQAVRLRYRFRGAWSDRWDGAGGVALPQALELRVQRASGVEYRQLFLVGSGYAPLPVTPDAPR